MKYAKMLGLAALAALAITAVMGAGSASATELCSTNTSPCTGTMYGPNQEIHAVLKSGTIATLTASPRVTCTASTIKGKLTNTGGAGIALDGDLETLTFTGCTADVFGNPSCTVTSTGLPTTITGTATGGGNGTVSTGTAGATVVCAGGILNCTFTAPGFTLSLTGGNPGHITATEVPLTGSGSFCPEEAKWDATYEVTTPKPAFLVNP